MAGLPDRGIRGSLEDAQDGPRTCRSTHSAGGGADATGRRKGCVFLRRLMHSGRDFAWTDERQDQIRFLVRHVRAFPDFAGVPPRVAYDNLRAAVVRILVGGARTLTPRFAALASHYLPEAGISCMVRTDLVRRRSSSPRFSAIWIPTAPRSSCRR